MSNDLKKKTAIKQAIIEISNSMLQIESHREHIKEVINKLSEDYEVDKAVIKNVANLYHKQSVETVKTKNDTVIDFYDSIFG